MVSSYGGPDPTLHNFFFLSGLPGAEKDLDRFCGGSPIFAALFPVLPQHLDEQAGTSSIEAGDRFRPC